MAEEDIPLLHRTATTSRFGKCDSRVDLPMPLSIVDDFKFVARLKGKTLAEWSRDVLIKEAAGELALMGMSIGGAREPGDGTNVG